VPTFATTRRLEHDLAQLTAKQREAFRATVRKFVADLAAGTFRTGLRVKGVQAAESVFEITWAPGGRATFEFGPSVRPGEPHVVWRRVGTHDDILRQP
jgi:hypothetical protein